MGNRVKGRVKKKSIKACVSSSMGSKRKLSRMGKKRKKNHSGLDATFIGRSACLKRLQVSIKDFRRLCILKGVYPREPRGRTPSKKKGQVYYHIKDVRALAHEPLLEKFREFRAFMKKVRKAAGRNEKEEAERKQSYAPSYTLHHLVRERYPRFVDALSDLDDAVSLIYLFAALPSTGRIATKVTKKAQLLAAQWGSYCAITSSLTKSFISVKGVYMEASIENCCIRWVIPHAFTQFLPTDVDFRVMMTFFEFYETLLGFVLYKLFNDIGIHYPLAVTGVDFTSSSSVLAAHLHVLNKILRKRAGQGSATLAVMESIKKQNVDIKTICDSEGKDNNLGGKKNSKQKRELLNSVSTALSLVKEHDSDDSESMSVQEDDGDDVNISAPLMDALESITKEKEESIGRRIDSNSAIELNDDAKKRKRLFSGLTFFLSREIPKGYIELACLSYGAKVGWEGNDSLISVTDSSITHHITDRPKIPPSFEKLPKSREFIQPQWILDSANFNYLLPTDRYGIGVNVPPHLSPWVNNDEEGYTPEYAEEVERLKSGLLPSIGEQNSSLTEAISDENTEMKNSTLLIDKDQEIVDSDDAEGTSEEDDDMKVKEKAEVLKAKEMDEAKNLAKNMMSKKASRLYQRMQHGIKKKEANIQNLYKKRKEIELNKKGKTTDGKTPLKAKVERLKKERKAIEKDYENVGGMSKRQKRRQG